MNYFKKMIILTAMMRYANESEKEHPNYLQMPFSKAWNKFVELESVKNEKGNSSCPIILEQNYEKEFDKILDDLATLCSKEDKCPMVDYGVSIIEKLIVAMFTRWNKFILDEEKYAIYEMDFGKKVLYIKESNFPYWDHISGKEVDFIICKTSNGEYSVRKMKLERFYPAYWSVLPKVELEKAVKNSLKCGFSEVEMLKYGLSEIPKNVQIKFGEISGTIIVGTIEEAWMLIKNTSTLE